MATFGQRPGDVVTDSRGSTLAGVTVKVYTTEAAARAGGTPDGTAVTDEAGRWSITSAASQPWARLPDGSVWPLTGADGRSAYDVAVDNGFIGDEAAWLASLQGADGTNGTNGTNGVGVPAGGTAGQVLSKLSATDFDTSWADAATGGGPTVDPSGDTTGATDTAAIQAAIDALTTGGEVRLEGTYYINAPLVLDEGVWIVGAGWTRTAIHLAAGSNCSMIQLPSTATTIKYYGVRDLTLDGHKEDQTAGTAGIDFRGGATGGQFGNCAFGWALRVYVQYTYGHGIYTSQVENRIEQCFAYRPGKSGVNSNGIRVESSDSWIINCTTGETAGDGIYVAGISQRVIGCKAWWAGYQNSSRLSGSSKSTDQINGNASCYLVEGKNHQFYGCEAQDASYAGWKIDCVQSSFKVHADISGNWHVLLYTSAVGNNIDLSCGDGSDHGVTPNLIGVWSTSAQRNHIRSTFYKTNGSTLGVTNGLTGGGSGAGYNTYEIGTPEAFYTETYAASVTPDPFMGAVNVTLTGNITIANTASDRLANGQTLVVRLTEDATGGRTVSWGTQYVGTTAAVTTANKVNVWTFRCVKDKWVQTSFVSY